MYSGLLRLTYTCIMFEECMDIDPPDGKENSKKMKLTRGEKSKIAAKGRRDKEHVAMMELTRELPVSQETLNRMDKAAIVKLAVNYIKIKHYVQKDISTYGHKALTDRNMAAVNNVLGLPATSKKDKVLDGQLMMEALNGFLIFVNRRGNIKFVSATIQDHLGLKQEYLFGKNVVEYIHECDHQELIKQFTEDKKSNLKINKTNMASFEEEPQRVFYVRMKFNLPKPGSKAKHTGYMLVQWTGKMKRHISSKTGTLITDGLLCICRPMQTTPMLEIRMDGNMFMSRHDMGMTFTFCDTRIITLIGYEPSEVVGKTAYHFHNPVDAPKVGDCHQNLIVKGTSISKYYRFLGKTDNWVWLQTRATIIYNTANKPQYIVCMNYVISEEEGERYLMLEEHQHANQHTQSKVLMLPDNHHTLPVEHVHMRCPKIVELEEENLQKTACFNGELDEQPTTDEPIPQSKTMVNITDYQQNAAGSVQSPGPQLLDSAQTGVLITECQSTAVTDEISQQMFANESPIDALKGEDINTLVEGPVQNYMPVCSPAGSTATYASSPGLPQPNDQHNGSLASQSMGASCSSSHSEDGGYESASSPYNATYFSPQMMSPACNYDNSSDRGFTSDVANPQGFIQGQNCLFGGRCGPSEIVTPNNSMVQGDNSMDILNDTNAELPNPVLDEILLSLSQASSDNLGVNMALVYSTMESLTSQSPASVSTSVKSPVTNTKEYMKPMAKPMSQPVSQLRNIKTDSSLLRSFLTMPQEAIPRQLCNKISEKSGAVPKRDKIVAQGRIGKQLNTSAQNSTNLNQKSSNVESSCGGSSTVSNNVNGEIRMDSSEMIEADILDDIQEFALQYLNDFTDAQAQALIADLQSEGGIQSDTFMDTSENDLTKEFVSSLENQSSRVNSGDECGIFSSVNSPVSSSIPFTLCRNSCYTFGSDLKCNNVSKSNLNKFNGNSSNCCPGNTAHDHVYHQSMNTLNGQSRPTKCQKSPNNYSPFNKYNGAQDRMTCANQTQTSEHCMSELERHLRNKLCSNSDTPFLQQLLTGELTNDMYMRMERERLDDKPVAPK